jgi:peptidoglycan/xylan/chitin deacetylase (PgdA/CDA1 family)
MTQHVPVLLYHSIGTSGHDGLAPWEVSPDVFAGHLRYLDAHDYTVLPLATFARGLRAERSSLPPRPVVITFDDGYANFTTAASLLVSAGVPATLFVPTAAVGGTSSWLPGPAGDEPLLSWSAIADLDAAGIEIGAHARHHVALDELSRATIQEEVQCSKRDLEEQLGHEVTGFAYPFGYSDGRVRRAVAGAGYGYACAVKDSLSGPNDDRYALARLFVPPEPDLVRFGRVLEHGTRRYRKRERAITKAWRTWRRARRLTSSTSR